MTLKKEGYLFLAALALCAVACKVLPGDAARPGENNMQLMPYTDAIPAAWGDLISVTADAEWTYSTMWFQDDSGRIRLVGFHHENRQLLDSVAVLNRR